MEHFPQSLAPYTERNGVYARTEADELLANPEIQLSEEEEKLLHSFSAELFYGKSAGGIESGSKLDLEAVNEISATEPEQTFYLEYFQTPEGLDDLATLGISDTSSPAIAKSLLDIGAIGAKLSSKERKKIAARSLNKFHKKRLASWLDKDASQDDEYLDDEALTVNYQPEKLIEKLGYLQAYRKFYKEIRQQIKPDKDGNQSRLDALKSLLLDKYSSKVNSQIADLYPNILDLIKQLEQSEPSPENLKLKENLNGLNPTIKKAVEREQTKQSAEFNDRFARRLDLLKQGGGKFEQGDMIPTSDAALALADELDRDQANSESSASVPTEVIEKLKNMEWTPEQVAEFLQSLLKQWNLLSDFSNDFDEIEKREGFAPDGKLQVSIHPQETSFSFGRIKGAFWVPANYDSAGSADDLGPLPVIAHEATHGLQKIYDLALAKQLPLAKIGGRRNGTLREAGAIHQERKVKQAFGQDRPVNSHHLRAMQAKLAGGNKAQVARAFFNAYMVGKDLNEAQTRAAKLRAADRALRPYRAGGHDSGSLEYIEQELLWRELMNYGEGVAEVISIAGASLSLSDSAQMHKSGLLNLPSIINFHPAEDVVELFAKE